MYILEIGQLNVAVDSSFEGIGILSELWSNGTLCSLCGRLHPTNSVNDSHKHINRRKNTSHPSNLPTLSHFEVHKGEISFPSSCSDFHVSPACIWDNNPPKNASLLRIVEGCGGVSLLIAHFIVALFRGTILNLSELVPSGTQTWHLEITYIPGGF